MSENKETFDPGSENYGTEQVDFGSSNYDFNQNGANYGYNQGGDNYGFNQGGNYDNGQNGNYGYNQGGNYGYDQNPQAQGYVPGDAAVRENPETYTAATAVPETAVPAPEKTKKRKELSRKKRIVWTAVLLTVLALLLCTEALLVGTVIRLKMVPEKYLFALIGGLAVIAGLVAFLMFVRFKKPVCLARKIIAILLAVVFAVPCYFGSQFSIKTRDTVETVSGKALEEIEANARSIYVLVMANDPAQTVQQAGGYSFGVVENYDVSHTENAITQVEMEVGGNINIKYYSDFFALAKALYDQEVKAVIMNGALIELLCSEVDYESFSSRVRILKEMRLADLLEPGEEDPLGSGPLQPYPLNLTQMPFVFYLSGSDTRNDKLTVSRSDVNILVVVNPTTRQILMINTPRDYHVPNPVGNGALDKLTHCGLYGPRCSIQVLEDLYDVDINFYGQINFRGLETLIDAMGGVSVFSDESFRAGTTYIQVGRNELDGASALEFARERHHVTGGDNGRGKNQMRLMEGIIEKLTSGTTILTRYSEILGSLEGMFVTSATADDISTLVKFQLDEMPTWNIQSFAVTGIPGNAGNYSAPGTTAYVTHIDQTSVDYAADLIDRVFQNEILTESDMTMPKK